MGPGFRRDADLFVNCSGNHLRDDQEQIGVAGLLAGGGQQRVRLAAVMRLMVEEMGDEEPLRRADLALWTEELELVSTLIGGVVAFGPPAA